MDLSYFNFFLITNIVTAVSIVNRGGWLNVERKCVYYILLSAQNKDFVHGYTCASQNYRKKFCETFMNTIDHITDCVRVQ